MTYEEALRVLGLEHSSWSEEDLKKAYRKKVKQDHPDQTGGDETKLQRDKEAYEFLKANEMKTQKDPEVAAHTTMGEDINVCLKCHGTGKINKKETFRGRAKLVKVTCPRCRGKGYLSI